MTTIALIFASVSSAFNLPPGLLSAVCYVESGHKAYAIHKDDGGQDSIGVCQLHLSTARYLGYKGSYLGLWNPTQNIFWAGVYLRNQLARYHGDIRKALAAYNAGTYRQNAQGFTLNRRYVSKVLIAWKENR